MTPQQMNRLLAAALAVAAAVSATACSRSDAGLIANGARAGGASPGPQVLRGVDGVPGWTRTGPPELYKKDGLYGYIDGGAEIVLQYGFRELSVARYRPAGDPGGTKEITLEIYRMTSGEAAFGLYSTKLEGGETAWPGIAADNWVGGGQASFVKGEYFINILAPGCDDRETGEFLAHVERHVPGRVTIRPEGMARLPREGMVPSSGHFVKGPLAAQNESPFLDGGFWGFDADADGPDATLAFSAKYGAAPAVSKFVIVELGKACDTAAVDAGIRALFAEYLGDVRLADGIIEGRNEAGRWFLYGRSGDLAGLVLGEPDIAAARSRLQAVLAARPGERLNSFAVKSLKKAVRQPEPSPA
jgi:hypothetical protein